MHLHTEAYPLSIVYLGVQEPPCKLVLAFQMGGGRGKEPQRVQPHKEVATMKLSGLQAAVNSKAQVCESSAHVDKNSLSVTVADKMRSRERAQSTPET